MKKQLLVSIAFLISFAYIFSFEAQAFAEDEPEIVEVETLLELRGKEAGGTTIYKITGEVVITYQQDWRNNKWIQDATAGVMIDDPTPTGAQTGVITTTYKLNDGIKGLTGRLAIFRNNYQFIPTEDPGSPSSTNNTPTVVERTLANLSPDDQGRLVIIQDLAFHEDNQGNPFIGGRSLTVTDPSGTGIFRTEFRDADYIGSTIPDTLRTVTAIVHMFNDDIQIVARSLADLNITDMPNIRALRNQDVDNSTVYTLTSEAFLSYQQSFRNKKWIQDETAGIEIDDNPGVITSTYNINDGITGIKGKLNYNNNMLQFIPVEDPGAASSADNDLLVVERTLAELDSEDQGRLVLIKDLSFDAELHGQNFATGRNLLVSDSTASGTYFRTEFYEADYIGSPIPTVAQNLTAILRQFRQNMQVTPRSLADFEAVGEEPRYSVTFNITDDESTVVEDAVVTLNDETYESGMYVIEELLPGTYSYLISKEGYYDYTGEVVVSSEDLIVDIMLIAVDPNIITEFPWTEGFEEGFPPAGWKKYEMGDAGSWTTHPTANSGSVAAYHEFTAPGQEANSWLVTPQIKLPEDVNMLFSFFERNASFQDYGYSGVWISTGSGIPSNDHFIELSESDLSRPGYTEKMLNLSEYKGKVVYLAFVYKGADAHNWWIDDVKIDLAPDVIEVSNIARLREIGTDDGTVFRITGQIILTHQNGNRNQKYFQDETAGILVDDPRPQGSPVGSPGIITTEYDEYDAIAGLTGKLSLYNEMLQFTPTEDPGPPLSKGNTVDPIILTIADMKPEHQSMLVHIKGVSITHATHTNFAGSTSYIINDGTAAGILRTPNAAAGLDYFGTAIPTTAKDITGVVVQFQTDIQIAPRSLADFQNPDNTDVPELSLNEVVIYPNPANDRFTVKSSELIDSVRIFDLQGRMIVNMIVSDYQSNIDTGKLNNGLYIVQVVSGNKIVNQKLQVTK